MSTPSLALFPCAYDTGKLYSVLPDTGAGDFTVSRNGTATYFDKDGLLRTAQPNEPRFDFDPLTGDFKGVLIEPAATNLLLRSEEFNDAYWTKGNFSTVSSNVILSPDNTLTGDKHVSANFTSAFAFVRGSLGLTNDVVYTLSVFLKIGEVRYVQLRIGGVLGNCFCNFDLLNGTAGTPTNCTPNVKEYPNGWYKCSITYTKNENRDSVAINMVPAINSVQAASYPGNGVDGYFLWGAQLEEGSAATSYIPTVASTVTRPADIIDVTVPAGVTSIEETVNGVTTTITSIPVTYQLPNGHVSKVIMA
jgi:hypothetical protein